MGGGLTTKTNNTMLCFVVRSSTSTFRKVTAMAKEKKPGPGKKECPSCGAVLGARKMECECGHTFTPKQRKTKVTTVDFGAAMAMLKELAGFIEDSGGYDEALAWIDKTEQLVAQTGGFDALREGLDAARGLK